VGAALGLAPTITAAMGKPIRGGLSAEEGVELGLNDPRAGTKIPDHHRGDLKTQIRLPDDAYFELDLPVAPAVMVGDQVVVEGADTPQLEIEAAICKQLGLPPPEPAKKGVLRKLFPG
jgi:hypothetical protein